MSKRILIIDDDAEILPLIEKKLLSLGFITKTNTSGSTILNDVRQFNPDLILLDIVLPDIDGGDAARILQNIPEYATIPIIFLSGIVSQDDPENEKLTIGKFMYKAIGKPFSTEKLIQLINQYF